MAIGERIRYFRTMKGITQKALGIQLGYPEKAADIRIAQYESGTRTPKADTVNKLAEIFSVSPAALDVPNTSCMDGIMQTLFSLEDSHGITLTIRDEGSICILTDPTKPDDGLLLNLYDWARRCDQLRKGEISQTEYDSWRYNSSGFISHSETSK